MKKNNEQGFSLVELLVVVIIIAIVAAIAIPNLLASRRAANDASAISTLRTIHSAEVTYYANNNQTYTTTAGLTGLIDPTLAVAAPSKSGFDFASTFGTGVYCATATRQSNSTGNSGYGVNETGVIYKYASGSPGACASGALTLTGGSPLG